MLSLEPIAKNILEFDDLLIYALTHKTGQKLKVLINNRAWILNSLKNSGKPIRVIHADFNKKFNCKISLNTFQNFCIKYYNEEFTTAKEQSVFNRSLLDLILLIKKENIFSSDILYIELSNKGLLKIDTINKIDASYSSFLIYLNKIVDKFNIENIIFEKNINNDKDYPTDNSHKAKKVKSEKSKLENHSTKDINSETKDKKDKATKLNVNTSKKEANKEYFDIDLINNKTERCTMEYLSNSYVASVYDHSLPYIIEKNYYTFKARIDIKHNVKLFIDFDYISKKILEKNIINEFDLIFFADENETRKLHIYRYIDNEFAYLGNIPMMDYRDYRNSDYFEQGLELFESLKDEIIDEKKMKLYFDKL